MRTKMLAAYVFAAICLALISCNWFSKKNVTTSLIGRWKVTAITDSSVEGLQETSLFAIFSTDTAKFFVNFISDSTTVATMKDSNEKDTSLYYIDAGRFITYNVKTEKKDTFVIKDLNDTLFRIMRDSLCFTFKKQP